MDPCSYSVWIDILEGLSIKMIYQDQLNGGERKEKTYESELETPGRSMVDSRTTG